LILHKLTLANFRQFKGVQTIEFAYPLHDNRNVTVIFGENGRGKTGIFRAIMFCLFGDRRLSQDGDVHDSELQLVNVSALENGDGKAIETYVELEFTHLKTTYVLKRGIVGMRSGDKILEEYSETRMVRTTPDGNSKLVESDDIPLLVNSIIDRRVKDYFMFDGEKIERLTRADVEQRREIGKGIRNLLNVNALETAIKATDRLTRELEDQLRKEASPELARVLKRLADNEQEQKDKKQRLDDVGKEVTLARAEIIKVDKELDAYKEIRGLLEKRKTVEQLLQGLDQQAKDQLVRMKELSVRASSLLVATVVARVFEHIERQKQKGDIPSEIRRDLIERILSESRCICGNEVSEGTEAYNLILQWKNRTTDVATQDAALNLWRLLSQVKGTFEDDVSQVENRLLAYANTRNQVESARRTLEELRQSIGSSERQDASKLDTHRRMLETKIVKLEYEASILDGGISDLNKEHGQLIAQFEETKVKQGRHDELSVRASLSRSVRDALLAIYEDFTKEIKTLIGQRATGLFHELLDAEGRQNLRTIVVNEDYSLQVLDRWNRPFLANISAGQRQVMSISFIAALAQVAAKDAHLEIPLFMDTPFGRLSFDHRQNIITKIPDLSSQWVLLATDTEFRRQEARLLTLGERWGKFYSLEPVGDGNTLIRGREVDSVPSLLRDEADLP
jgi:DNA sulfur modification protein DndD